MLLPRTSLVTAPDRGAAGLARGILLMTAAVGLFTLMAALIKLLGPGFPASQVVAFRAAPALLPLFLWLHFNGGFGRLRTRRPLAQAVRTVSGVCAMYIGFYALPRMPIADYVAISFTAPLFATLLAVPILKERLGLRRLSAVVIGFAGVVLTVQPTGAGMNLIGLLVLGAAFGYAVAILAMRTLGATDSSGATVFYFTAAALVVGVATAPVSGWIMPRGIDWVLLVTVGLLGGVAQLLLTEAYRNAPPSVLAPFDYSALVWAILLGLVLFGDFPADHVLLGALIICGSGLFIWHLETRLQKPPASSIGAGAGAGAGGAA